MSKVYDLMEKMVAEEFKAQSADANNNIFLAAYGFVIGVVFLHLAEISSAFAILHRSPLRIPAIVYELFFFIGLLGGSLCFLVQILFVRLPKDDDFTPDLNVCRYEIEERTVLLAGAVAYMQPGLEEIDSLVSDIIRRRIITDFCEATKNLRYYNVEKRKLQRWTGICLLTIVFTGGWAVFSTANFHLAN